MRLQHTMNQRATMRRTVGGGIARLGALAILLGALPMHVSAQIDDARLSRRDLPRLKTLDRAGVFEALRSFDHRGLNPDEFAEKAMALLDADRIPGLPEALAAGQTDAALQSVLAACKAGYPVPDRTPASDEMLAAADHVSANRFTFYGERHQLPQDIDWDHNPGTRHWGHDLNRFGFLNPLVKAYVGTGDERYSRKAVSLILDWINKCDMGQCFRGSPYVWGSYLNNAIHCQSWCRALQVLIPAEQLTPQDLLRILKSLHDQLAYLEIVTNGHSGNWPTIGVQSMLECVGTFPVLRDTDRFADYAAATLRRQLAEQVLPDGVQYELTPHYHRVVINNVLNAAHWLRKLDRDLDEQTVETALPWRSATLLYPYKGTVVPGVRVDARGTRALVRGVDAGGKALTIETRLE